MKKLILVLVLILSFGNANGQRAFTVESGSLSFVIDSDTMVYTNGYLSTFGGARICEPSGRVVLTLLNGSGEWNNHSINGVTYTDLESFAQSLRAEGWGGSKAVIDVDIQDNPSDRISILLAYTLGDVISMSGTAKDVDVFNIVTDGTVPAIGEYICFQEDGKVSQEELTSVVLVSGNEYTVTISEPLDYDYTTASACVIQTADMNINTIGTVMKFEIGPKGDYSWDITRMIVSMVLTTAGDDGKFGNLTALTTSQYFRKEDSDNSQNLFEVKENSDFRLEGYDLSYPLRSGGGGDYGLAARITFNGRDKSGVVIRLNGITNDRFQTSIRDSDLSGIVKYRVKLQGHVVR